MDATTYGQLAGLDPTNSNYYKATLFLERLLLRFRLRLVVETAHLLFLGFFEDFRIFLQRIEDAENASQSEAEFMAVWNCKTKVGEKTSRLVSSLESIGNYVYKGRDLVDYVAGRDHLEEMKLFVRVVQFEREAEGALNQTKMAFLTAFGQRKLTQNQRSALLKKYRELTET